MFHRLAFAALSLILAGCLALTANAQGAKQFFQIGTGGTAGTYFPVGQLIAGAISNPGGEEFCSDPEVCGVPDLVSIALTSEGSVANILNIGDEVIESGFSQADVASWAFTGKGQFEGRRTKDHLRVIANLYTERLHLVVRADSDIRTVQDLRRKRVSLGPLGSGTAVDAHIILRQSGFRIGDVEEMMRPTAVAADMLRAGELDAFFSVSGTPERAIANLARHVDIRLVPIDGELAEQLVGEYPFFQKSVIPADTYKGNARTNTISVGALWVTHNRVDAELIYNVTRALWNNNTRELLDKGHPRGREITLETAVEGLPIPLHAGARRYYREVGVID